GHTGQGAHRHGMVAAKDQWKSAAPHHCRDLLGQLLRDCDDLLMAMRLRLRRMGALLAAIGNREVAVILHHDPHSPQSPLEVRVADRRRAHIDATAVATEIHRDADDLDGARRDHFFSFCSTKRISPSVDTSPFTDAVTFARPKARCSFSITASSRSVSPGTTMRLKRISSIPAKSPMPPWNSGIAMAHTAAVCASASTCITPGMIG